MGGQQGPCWWHLLFRAGSARLMRGQGKGGSLQQKNHFTFLKNGGSEYKRAVDDTTIFSVEGKNVTDDAADSLAGLAEMKEEGVRKKARIYSSMF